MKLFRCSHCGAVVYFENTRCESCGHALGYWPETEAIVSLDTQPDGCMTSPALPGQQMVPCANAAFDACNWLVPHEPAGNPYCRACRHNELVPDVSLPGNLANWQTIERAKKRLLYSLLRLRLPLATRNEDPVHGLSFRFLAEEAAPAPVMTGHDNGIITLSLKEADDATREYRRTLLNEPYRTLLGHFRHEVGHHYWDILIGGGAHLDEFRTLFGDERADYAAALERHYAGAIPSGWQGGHISAYATAHPWEDWAETWAHYLHIVDTIDTAAAFGVDMRAGEDPGRTLAAHIEIDAYRASSAAELMENWVPLAALINNLNRAVGQHDAYPFVLTPPVIAKLDFVHKVVRAAGSAPWVVPGPEGPVPVSLFGQ